LGGWIYSPTTSSSLAAKSGSVERLKVRRRWGCSLWAAQMRCTVRSDTSIALAMARPVQWVGSPGGSAQVSAISCWTTSGGTGALPGLRVASRKRPSAPASANRRCQRHTAGAADPGTLGDLGDRQPFGRVEDDPRPRHMLLGAVTIGQDRLQTSTIRGRDQRTYELTYGPIMPQPRPSRRSSRTCERTASAIPCWSSVTARRA
jgi:hypothetical protein